MHARSAIRRGLSGVAAILAASAALAGTPAHAAEEPVLAVSLNDLTISADGSPGKVAFIHVFLRAVQNPVLTIDSSDLAGVATVEVPDGCSDAGTTVTCHLPSGADLRGDLPVLVHPAPGSKAGDSGSLVVRTSGDNVAPDEHSSEVTLAGDGIDLVVIDPEFHTSAHTGEALTLPIAAYNAGNRASNGIRFTLQFDHGIMPEIYDNCAYGDENNQRVAVCETDDVLAPGDVIGGDFGVSIAKDSPPEPLVDIFAQGLAEAPLPLSVTVHRQASTGRTLKLSIRSMSANALPTDVDQADNFGAQSISVVNSHHDLAAVGATASGGQGAVVKVPVAAKNLGPAALDSTRPRLPAVRTFFTVPPGTTVVAVPQGCSAVVVLGNGQTTDERGKTGEQHYACWTGPTLLLPGKSTQVTFSLRIDTVTTGATGKSSVDDTFDTGAKPYKDDNPADNTADVVINPAGGSGGGLPVTGSPTTMLATGGALVVLLGAVLLLVARRRRTA
jgi:LPXTG-motif cell wall-anchored protein